MPRGASEILNKFCSFRLEWGDDMALPTLRKPVIWHLKPLAIFTSPWVQTSVPLVGFEFCERIPMELSWRALSTLCASTKGTILPSN